MRIKYVPAWALDTCDKESLTSLGFANNFIASEWPEGLFAQFPNLSWLNIQNSGAFRTLASGLFSSNTKLADL